MKKIKVFRVPRFRKSSRKANKKLARVLTLRRSLPQIIKDQRLGKALDSMYPNPSKPTFLSKFFGQ